MTVGLSQSMAITGLRIVMALLLPKSMPSSTQLVLVATASAPDSAASLATLSCTSAPFAFTCTMSVPVGYLRPACVKTLLTD